MILDVGGRHAPFTRRLKRRIVVVDMFRSEGLPTRLAWDSQTVNRLRQWPGVSLVCADACELSLQSDVFDLIVCTEVLEHIVDDKTALREMSRVLRRNGTLFATVPNASSRPEVEPFHHRHYSLAGLHEAAIEYFRDVQILSAVPYTKLLQWSIRSGQLAFGPGSRWGMKRIVLLALHMSISIAALAWQTVTPKPPENEAFSIFMIAQHPRETPHVRETEACSLKGTSLRSVKRYQA